jgi:F-type H+-transporting ATPase subunit b
MLPVLLAASGISQLGINLPGLIAQLINFGILLVLFTWVFRKFVFPMMDERRRKIQEGLQASEDAKKRLAETEQDVSAEMQRARQEAQALIAQAQQTSARMAEEGRQQARVEAEQILERARGEIQLERDNAISELRREFADLTITAAERVIRRSLDREAQHDLIEQVLQEAPRPGAGGGASNN